MGQKTNPKGFRLITIQKHLSNFYKSKTNYPSSVKDDFFIRSTIHNILNNYISLSNIEINRKQDNLSNEEFVNITIYALYPRKKQVDTFMISKFPDFKKEKEKLKKGNDRSTIPYILGRVFKNYFFSKRKFAEFIFKRDLLRLIHNFKVLNKKNYNFNIQFIRGRFEDASLIAKFIAGELKRRIPFRRVLKIAISKIKSARGYSNVKGLKIQLSGRLNGIEIARSEWKRVGNIPLHTLEANIDYTHEFVNTVYGSIGIKIWLYKRVNEKI